MNGHAPENGYFSPTKNNVNGYAPEKGARERACSGIQVILLQFFVLSSCFKPFYSANRHEKRGFEGSTFNLKLKSSYSNVGGYAPEYVIKPGICKECGGNMVIIDSMPNQFRERKRAPPELVA